MRTSLRTLANLVGLVVLALLVSVSALANSGITYQGRILKPDGTPLAGANVQFKLQIRTPDNNNCLMYEEMQALDMRNSNGVFALTMFDTSATRTDSSGYLPDKIFSNQLGPANTFSFNPATCTTGSSYTPNSGDGRLFVVYFKDETMTAFEPMPAQKINFVPFAFESKSVAGFTPASLVRVAESDGTLDSVSPLSNANYTELLNLINGTSTQYTKQSASAGSRVTTASGNVTTPSAGSVWLDTAAGNLKFYDGTTVKTVGTSGGSVTSVATGTGLTGGPITSSGTISLATLGAGGTGYKVTYDTYGRVTGAVALVEADIPTLTTAGHVSGSAITSGTIGGSTAINTSGTITSSSLSSTAIATQSVQIFETTNTYKVTLQSPAALGANYALTLPTTAGLSGQVMATNGSGVMNWVTPVLASAGYVNGGNSFAANASIGTNDAFRLDVKTNNLARMTIDNAGSVGIGTTAPSHAFEVDAGPTSGIVAFKNTNAAGYSSVDALDNSNAVQLSFGYANPSAGWNPGTAYFNANGGAPMIFAMGSGEKIRLAANGNVGIGTTAPTAALHLKAGTAAAGTAPLKLTTGILMTTPEDGAMEYASSSLYYTIGSTRYVIPLNTAAGNYSNVSTISNSSGSITMSPSAGNSVIVNSTTVSTSPTTGALVVSGGMGVSGAINTTGNILAGGSITATTNGVIPQLYGSTAASGNIKIDGTSNATVGNVLLASAGGSVGIGTTAPDAKLNVIAGSGNATSTMPAANSAFQFETGVAVGDQILVGGVDKTNRVSYIQSDNYGYGVEPLLLNARGGNVGIGTTAPGSPLQVNNTLASPAASWYPTSASFLKVTGTTASVGGSAIYGEADMSSPSATGFGFDAKSYIRGANSTGASYVAQNGVYDPTSKVMGFYAYDYYTSSTAGTSYGLYIDLVNTSTIRYGVYQNSANPNYFAGNLGIGTTQASGAFSVTPSQYSAGTASQSLSTVTGVGTTWTSAMIGSQFVFANGVSAGTITAVGSATSLTVSTSQTVASQNYKIGYTGLQVTSAGNVGIGTTAPTSQLQADSTSTTNATDETHVAFNYSVQPTAAVNTRYGLYTSTLVPNTVTQNVSDMRATFSYADFSGSGTASNVHGIRTWASNNGTGTTTQLDGGLFGAQGGSGTVTDLRAVDVLAMSNSANVGSMTGVYVTTNVFGGTTTNRYGVFLATPSGVATGKDFGIYQQGKQMNSFGGNVGIGTTSPSGSLDVNQTTAGSIALQGENAGTAFWKVLNPAGGATNTWNAANAVEYIGKDTGTSRSINAAGTINASGADFAEWVDWQGTKPEMGSVVFYRGSYVVVSSPFTAAFVGNDVKDQAHSVLVAFAGQLPVLVRGVVHEGDLIVANDDGTARAVPKQLTTVKDAYRAVGTAWGASDDPGLKRVHVAVGIGLAAGLRDIASLNSQKADKSEVEQIKSESRKLKQENAELKARLDKIEKMLK